MSVGKDWKRLSELGFEAERQGDLETAWERHREAATLLGDVPRNDLPGVRLPLGLELVQCARLAAMTDRPGVAAMFGAALECAGQPPEPELANLVWHYVGGWFQRQELWIPSLLAYQQALDALPEELGSERAEALRVQLVPIDRLQEWAALLATLRMLVDAGVPPDDAAGAPSVASVLDQLNLPAGDRSSIEALLENPGEVQALREDLIVRARAAAPEVARRFDAGEVDLDGVAGAEPPSSAQAEAFNQGVVLADAGRDGDAETAYRIALEGGDQTVAAMAAVNLGGLLERKPERLGDAEQAYRRAIASGHADQAPMAAANLGSMLAGMAGREDEAEVTLMQAAASGHPEHAPRAHFDLGVLLLGRLGRRADAEAAFRTAAESGHPDHAPRAIYNLGRMLAEDPGRVEEARRALEEAVASGHPAVKGWAERLLAGLAGEQPTEAVVPAGMVALLERPAVDADRLGLHRVTCRSDGAGVVLEEYAPQGQSAEDFTELLSVVTALDRGAPLAAVAQASDAAIKARVIDGSYAFAVLDDMGEELIYGWTLEGDAIEDDQVERTRTIRGTGALHSVTYTVQGPIVDGGRRLDAVWPVVADAALAHVPMPERSTPPPPAAAEVTEILAGLQDPDKGDAAEREAIIRRGAGLVERSEQPELWASFQVLLGLQLRGRGHAREEAIAALRGALRVLGRDRSNQLWPVALAHLGRVYGLGAPGHAIGLLERAVDSMAEGTPEWAEALVDLGFVHEETGDLDAAARCYGPALDRIGAVEPVDHPPIEELARAPDRSAAVAWGRAAAGAMRVEQRRAGSPFIPGAPLDHPRRGHVAYLRPFVATGDLTIANRFAGEAWYVPKGGREPERMTLEAVLHRALGLEFLMMAVGGMAEGYGMARLGIGAGGDWRDLVETLLQAWDVILLVPHLSDGVRWEVDLLVRTGAIERTVLVMPPRSAGFDAAALWEGARPLLAEHELVVPAYDPEGMMVRCEPGRGVLDVWPFAEVFDGGVARRLVNLLGEP